MDLYKGTGIIGIQERGNVSQKLILLVWVSVW